MKKVSNAARAKTVLIFCFVFMASYALSYNMFSTLLPSVKEHYGMTVAQASLFTSAESVGQIIIMLLTAMFVDRLDKGLLLGLSVVLYGGVMMAIGSVPAVMVFIVLRVILGMMSTFVDNICGVYLADIYGDERTKYLSILHMLYGVGAMIGPQFAAYMLRKNPSSSGWGGAYMAVGAVVAAFGVLFLVVFAIIKKPVPVVDIKRAGEKVKIPYLKMLTNRNMIGLFVGSLLMSVFMYFMTWLPTYLEQLDPAVYTPETYATIIMMYSLGMIPARLLYAAYGRRFSAAGYLKAQGLLTAAVAAAGLLINNAVFWHAATFLIGFISGPNYTLKVVLACDEYPEYSATATSMTALFTGIGATFAAPIIGNIADSVGYTYAMFIPVVCMALVAPVFAFIYRDKKKA